MLGRRALLFTLLTVAFTAVGGPWSPAVAQVTLPTGSGGSEGGDATASTGPVTISLSLASVGFGDLEPGAVGAPVALDVANTGLVPVTLALSASALTEPLTDARISEDRLGWSLSAEGAPTPFGADAGIAGPALAPAAVTRIYVTLHVPSGDEQYVPEGDYEGTLTITATEVGP